jgi:hypothetical protein
MLPGRRSCSLPGAALLSRSVATAVTLRGLSAGAPVAGEDLTRDVLVADDRPGDQLRKQENVERKAAGVTLRERVLAVNIYQLGDRVKGEERNAEWQRDVR